MFIYVNGHTQIRYGIQACKPAELASVTLWRGFEAWLLSLQDPRTGEEVDKDLWVTRKGATSAQKGQYGVIPGTPFLFACFK